MTYPVWQVFTGPQIIIAVVGIIHLLIAQFAVGGGFFLVLAEGHASRHDDLPLKRWLEKFTRFFVILTVVFGASTGVGIWFTISLISPYATETLISVFLWIWAIEWVFFLVEIISIFIYEKTWRSLPGRKHRIVGWIYFISAWASLFAINGILTFQLTPGLWIEKASVTHAFFNPGLFPVTLTRTFISLILAGLYVLVGVSWKNDRILKADITGFASKFIWMSTVLLALSSIYAYFTVSPLHIRAGSFTPSLHTALWIIPITAIILFSGGVAVTLQRYRLPGKTGAIVLLIAGILLVGAFEFVREDLRKPYLIPNYLYANHVTVKAYPEFRKEGFLEKYPYLEKTDIDKTNSPAIGKLIFDATCSSCHTARYGMNPVASNLAGLDKEFLTDLVLHSDLTRYRMPPFPGTKEEASAVADYLIFLSGSGTPGTDGQSVWNRRCYQCHSLSGTFRPLSISGMDSATIRESLLTNLKDIDGRMPAWTGTDEEARTLSEFLSSSSGSKK